MHVRMCVCVCSTYGNSKYVTEYNVYCVLVLVNALCLMIRSNYSFRFCYSVSDGISVRSWVVSRRVNTTYSRTESQYVRCISKMFFYDRNNIFPMCEIYVKACLLCGTWYFAGRQTTKKILKTRNRIFDILMNEAFFYG